MRTRRFASSLATIAVASGISLGAFAQSASAQESLKDDFEPVFMPFTWAGYYAGLVDIGLTKTVSE